MGRPRARSLLAAAVVAAALVAPAGCTDGEAGDAEAGDADADRSPATAELGDLVSLTVYLRTGGSQDDLLEPVAREVPITEDLPRRAVQLLFDGPQGSDEEDLESPWPEGTELNDVVVDGGSATVDLTGDVLADPPAPEQAAHLEALALASLANTLTEFPGIDEVEVTVDGRDVATDEVEEFWGGWGLPETLSRDVTLVADESEGALPALDDFVTDSQSVGSEDAEPVVIRSVRVRDRITYLRLVVELADADDRDSSATEIPRTYARTDVGELVLEVTDAAAVDEAAMPSDLDEQLDPLFAGVELGDGARPDSVRIALEPVARQSHRVYLHTANSPSRVVLDVKK